MSERPPRQPGPDPRRGTGNRAGAGSRDTPRQQPGAAARRRRRVQAHHARLIRRRRTAAAVAGLAILLAVILVATNTHSASASRSAGPLTIRSSSLTQDGTQLRWRVQTTTPLDPATFTRTGRSICLRLWTNANDEREICLAAPATGSSDPQLRYTSASGVSSSLVAYVTRPSADTVAATFTVADIGAGNGRLTWRVASGEHQGCTAGASGCGQSVSTTARALTLSATRLVGCRVTGQSVVYHGSRAKRVIALTFDDGPWDDPPTIDFVNELHRLGAVGTFFEIGDQIARYDPTGAVERKMLADGDMIGDHTWSHPDMLELSKARQLQELEWERDVVKRKTGFTECLFRPPYAYFDTELTNLARSLGMATVQWDVDTDDWEQPGVAKIVATVEDHARAGSVIIMHFGGGDRQQTIAALPKIVAYYRAHGFGFVTIPQLYGYKLIYR